MRSCIVRDVNFKNNIPRKTGEKTFDIFVCLNEWRFCFSVADIGIIFDLFS